MECDIAVLGGGAAGLTAVELARSAEKRVVLIEEARLGGECTWDGCIPSKALLKAAGVCHDLTRAGEFGIRIPDPDVDFSAVMRYVQATIAEIARFENTSHLERKGITVMPGRGRLTSPTTLVVNGETVRAERIIVCTGSKPAIPAIVGLGDVPYLTNQTLFTIERLPRHLLILGAGATGLEMGQAFRRLGSAVTILDVATALLPREDPDIVQAASSMLTNEGIHLMLNTTITRVDSTNDGCRLTVSKNGEELTVEGDVLLVAAGRRPSTDDLGLELAGVQVERRGVVVNERLQTSAPSIYAAGDVTGILPFTHIAAYQSRVAVENALGKRSKASYRVAPWIIFTDPEIAHVGLTEPEARMRHGDIRVVTLPFTAIDRAVIDRETRGMIKVVTGKKPIIGYLGGGELLGAHIIGAGAGEMIHEFVDVMQTRSFAGRLAQAIHAYPSMSVGVQQAVGQLFPSGRATVDLRKELDS